jgi:hypothetical protein
MLHLNEDEGDEVSRFSFDGADEEKSAAADRQDGAKDDDSHNSPSDCKER